MLCKVCNTRIEPGSRQCLNCGTDAPAEAAFSRPARPVALPSASLEVSEPEEEEEAEAAPKAGEIRPVRAPRPSGPVAASDTVPLVTARPAPAARPAAPAPRPAPPPARPPAVSAPDRAGLRALLAEQPGLLEEGLTIFREGEPEGGRYATGVGEIDLLAVDGEGRLVVVLVAEKGEGEDLVAEVLRRVGWVRKHLGGGKRKVRGIVLCQSPPAGLSYAAAAVADTVLFKSFRVALSFEDLEA